MATVRLAQISDIQACWNHHKRLGKESGKQGDFIFSPIEGPSEESFEDFERECKQRWAKMPAEVGWERCWVIADSDGIYGDLNLVHRPRLKSCLHRATLMMGIERSHRKKGFGSQLMTHAVAAKKFCPSACVIKT